MAEHYMVYWKTFWDDIDSPLQVKCDWYTNKRDFFEGLRRGDSLWVVTSGEESHGYEWRLLQRLFVDTLDPVPSDSHYGRFRIIGNPLLSQLFDPDNQADFTPILKHLEFSTGKSIEFTGRKIGQALQSPRALSPIDADTLVKHSRTLTEVETQWGE